MINWVVAEAPASANVRVQLSTGHIIQVTLRDTDEARLLERLRALLQELAVAGATPAENGVARNGGGSGGGSGGSGGAAAPLCPLHKTPMKRSKHGGWFCPQKLGVDDDGSPIYCNQRKKG